MADLPVVTCPHGRHPGVRCQDCEVVVGPLCHWLADDTTLRDSSPPRDDTREPSKSVVFGRQLQDGENR